MTKHSLGAALCVALLAGSLPAQAAWPEKTIRVVVPFAGGSGTDWIGRAVADEMGKSLGVLPAAGFDALVVAAIVSIALNPLLFRLLRRFEAASGKPADLRAG